MEKVVGSETVEKSSEPERPRLREAISDSIGERLQALRKRYGLSQRELARRADVTNSTLSMIEQGKVSPSIGSLEKILHAFPISLQEFFSQSELSVAVVSRADDLVTINKGRAQYTLYSVQSSDNDLQMIKQEFPPGSKVPSGWMSQNGFIGGFVAEGNLTLQVEGLEYDLNKGDAFQFSLNREHEFQNNGTETCTIVSAVFSN